jgi:prepilin-type N-terminal cleavage/methylation domain-containing protein
MNKKTIGFTMIELLVVIAIIGILASIVFAVANNSRSKAADTRILNAVGQMRWMAELAYNGQGGSFINWSLYPGIQESLTVLDLEIDDAFGGTNVATIRDSDIQNYCISAPLKSDSNKHYCIDIDGVLTIVDQACPDSTPNKCSSS